MKSIGAQLYTVRDALTTPEQMNETLKSIKQMGYDSVQLFGGGLDFIRDCAVAAKNAELEIVGVLINIKGCEAFGEELFKVCKEFGILDIGISGGVEDCRNYGQFIERINRFAARTRAEGLSFSYHNHAQEFYKLPTGETAMDHFLVEFEKSVDFMPDTYWLQYGGYDVRYFLEQVKGRVKILHLKDMKATEQGPIFAEVGGGNLYFKGIIKDAYEIGVEHLVVEQDRCEQDPFECLKKSYTHLKALLDAQLLEPKK